jgi:hypothetical protein
MAKVVKKSAKSSSNLQQSLYQIGYDQLGPVLAIYMARLHSLIGSTYPTEATVLFAHRAGIRIQELYSLWLSTRDMKPPQHASLFRVSRIAALKGAFATAPTYALTGIGQELAHLDLKNLVAALLSEYSPDSYETDFDSEPLHTFIEKSHPTAVLLKNHLLEQSSLYKKYLATLTAGRKRVLLVDSGWKGTTQLALQQAFPDYQFEGVYFGVSGQANILG